MTASEKKVRSDLSDGAVPVKKRDRRAVRENLRGWGVIGPIVLYYAIFGLIPLGMVFYYSMTVDDIFKGTEFVGFANFVTIFTDSSYYMLLLSTLLIAVFTIGFSLVFGLLLAKLMTGPIRGKGFYRTVYYMPVVISMAVVAQICNVWLNYNDGSFNNLLTSLGLERIWWEKSTFWMFFWIIVICTWKGLGATVILFVAGLSGISPDIYEAADIDGADKWQKFFKITLPQLRPMMTFVLITSIIGAFNIFEPVQLISKGGPEGTTEVVMFQIYQEAFLNNNYGMGCALSVIVLVILLALTALNMKFGEAKD